MVAPRLLLTAIAAFGSACVAPVAAAQQAPDSAPKSFTESARQAFGAEPPAGDRQFSNQTVGVDDIIVIVDQCMALSPQKPSYWPGLKTGGWLLEGGKDFPEDYGWEGEFIRPGQRGKLIEHISQADILHCEASGETGSAERRAQIWAALIAHYRATPAAQVTGHGFIENIRREMPSALEGMYVSERGLVLSRSDENPKSTVISVDIF